MFVELVYDKRNVAGLPGAQDIILAELTRRVQRIFPDAEVRVKPMQANGLNSDASKNDREVKPDAGRDVRRIGYVAGCRVIAPYSGA